MSTYNYIHTSETLPSGLVRVDIVQDSDAENPAQAWDMVGKLVLIDRCRYDFGHETASHEELQALADDPNNICLPVYMYDHSGITIRTSPFSCPWDSGQVGVMYCTKQKAIKEWGKKLCTAKVREAAIKCMVAEIKEIDDYLTGNVWGFEVIETGTDEVLDSCWGFVGDPEYCLEEALASAQFYEAEILEQRRQTWRSALKEARERRYWSQRDTATTTNLHV